MSVSNPFLALAKSGGVDQGRFHTLDITGGTIGVSSGVATIAVSVDQAGTYNWSGGHTFSSQITATGGIAAGAALYRSNGTVSATGTTQGAAAALTKDINYVTSATGGSATAVKLPVGAQGLTIDVINATATTIQVFPQSSAAIDGLGTNAAFTLPAGAVVRFFGYSTTKWYGTVIQNGVTSLTGTAAQVSVSASTGAVTLSLPQDIATYSSPTFSTLNADRADLAGSWPEFRLRFTGNATNKKNWLFNVDDTGAFGILHYDDAETDYRGAISAVPSGTGAGISSVHINNSVDASGTYVYGPLSVNNHCTMTALFTSAPIIKTANWTCANNEMSYINNKSGSSCTVTLPTASSYTGRWILIKTIQAQTVVSASSNVKPLTSNTAGTAILAATAGKWAALQSDGSNWVIMMGN